MGVTDAEVSDVMQTVPALTSEGQLDVAGRPGPAALNSRFGSRLQVPRSGAWWFCLAVAVVLVVWGQSLALAGLCLALAGLAAVALAPPHESGSLGMLSGLPAGFVMVVAWGLTWGLACGAADVGAWASRGGALVGVALFSTLTGWAVLHRRGSISVIGSDGAGAVGFIGIMTFFSWVIASQPLQWWSRINSTGTDFLRHLRLIREVSEAGILRPGEVAYPRAFHAVVAWLTEAMGAPLGTDSLWRAVAPLAFLMLGLMLLAVMVIATRVTHQLVGPSWLGTVAAWVAAGVFLQTAWFDTFLAMGSVMNILVALALLALLVFGLEPSNMGSVSGGLVCACVLAVVANGWQLLVPVVGLAAIPWFVGFLQRGRRRVGQWVIWLASALLVLQGLGLRPTGGHGSTSVVATASTVTASQLSRPEWWWWVGILVAAMACVHLFRTGWRWWALSYGGMLLGASAVVSLFMRLTGSSWDLMLYYPAKALWTAMVVVIPVACAGATFAAHAIWRVAERLPRTGRAALRSAAAMAVLIVLAGVVGRGFAFPPHVAMIAEGRAGLPNWSLAVIEAMTRSPIRSDAGDDVLIFGVVPGADASLAAGGYPGVVDYKAMEALAHGGFEGAHDDPVKEALARRDMPAICDYLREHPNALRLTGPNPQAGPGWMVDSGCPRAVVRPENWISLPIGPVWLERSPWQGQGWDFPTFAQVNAVKELG